MQWTVPLLTLFAAAGSAVRAHTLLTNLFVDGVDQGDGTCLRLPNHPNNATFPQPSITGQDMACGFNGDAGVARTCAAQPGSSISLEFRDWPDGSKPGSIDPSHKGPCAVYMKKVDDATKNGTAAGDGWFRIFYQDYDATAQRWCTETLIANDGRLTVTLPVQIAGGDYLLRSELLALHSASASPPDPQFYISCAQVFMNSSSTTGKSQPQSNQLVSIPGYVNLSMPAMTFNLYKKPLALPYPGYGPRTYTDQQLPRHRRRSPGRGRSSSSSSSSSEVPSALVVRAPPPQQSSGLKPAGCILAVGNWCGVEVADYSTQDGCWNASKDCYTQESTCWSSAGPTGGAKCRIWEAKCKNIGAQCSAKNFNGPPDKGKDLTPPLRKVQLPAAYKQTADDTGAGADNDSASDNQTPASGASQSSPRASSRSPATSGVQPPQRTIIVVVTVPDSTAPVKTTVLSGDDTSALSVATAVSTSKMCR